MLDMGRRGRRSVEEKEEEGEPTGHRLPFLL
jgi:hypothetical protein